MKWQVTSMKKLKRFLLDTPQSSTTDTFSTRAISLSLFFLAVESPDDYRG